MKRILKPALTGAGIFVAALCAAAILPGIFSCGRSGLCASREITSAIDPIQGSWAPDVHAFKRQDAYAAMIAQLGHKPDAVSQITRALEQFRLEFSRQEYAFTDTAGRRSVPYLFASGDSSLVRIGVRAVKGDCEVMEISTLSPDRIRIRLPGEYPEMEYVKVK